MSGPVASAIAVLLLLWMNELSAQDARTRLSAIGNPSNPVQLVFAHLTDTHIGEGAPEGDFGTPGFLSDTLTGNESGMPMDRLRNVVNTINGLKGVSRPSVVIVSGDLTDSGERSEFMMARKLLEDLSVPYVPQLGNHDTWPYVSFGQEAATACGDSLMMEVFSPTYNRLMSQFDWDDGTRQATVRDSASGNLARFQNHAFTVAGVRFIFLDFNPRYHVVKDAPGIGPEAFVDGKEGRALHYLQTQLGIAATNDEQVVIVAHHPPLTTPVLQFSFSAKDRRRLAAVVAPHSSRVVGYFCGHLHRWARYRMRGAGVRVFETKASKSVKGGAMRVVTVHSR